MHYAFQKIQVQHAKTRFEDALKPCESFNVHSERAVALMFDTNVQNGGIGPDAQKMIKQEFQALQLTGNVEYDEVARLRIIANQVADASDPRWIEDVRTRKLTIANGKGVVHGIHYDLAVRGITLADYRTHKSLGAHPAMPRSGNVAWGGQH